MHPDKNIAKDIRDIGKIPIITNILNVICQSTGMGFSAVARVTDEKWITCTTRDDISFGLKPGDELVLKTTICDEIRHHKNPVIIDHVAGDPEFKDHHTPAQYGFQSYISVPIIRKDGSFFGTLCAIDPHPRELKSSEVLAMFVLFADLISFHLNAIEQLDDTTSTLNKERQANKLKEENQKIFTDLLEKEVQIRTRQLEENYHSLEKLNKELESFAYISSHDLQEPLRKIQTFVSVISEKELENLSEKGKEYFKRIQNSAERMQALINDLLAYSRTSVDERKFEITNFKKVVEQVMDDLKEELEEKNAKIEIQEMCESSIIPFQFRQLIYNIFSNALKFSRTGINPVITINCEIVDRETSFGHTEKQCHIKISDNGIGFDQKYGEKIFELFRSLHPKEEYNGTGIGLAIVKKIVENHGGTITASGKLQEGATFDIYLPVE
ncbi:ATP-binding protein [uncultured Flavobacterium sp.]|uniref:GAF domain-containing sensor histidine kinase n=1 Tax=uncultured Flavobacterium sp. TaxID=165435 RepID=UPI0025FB6504|nr:ATP-binding protein [uncultured Flavobacterium sp.]